MQSGLAVDVADGRITALTSATDARGITRLAGALLLPGTVNTHCHTFQSLLRGLGDDLDFMAWRDRVLYPYSTRLDREGIYLGAAFAFAEMLLHGATTCVDFFYLHDQGNDNAEAVIQAARDVGIRLVLARTMYDWEGAPARYRERPEDAARRTADLVAKYATDPLVSVQPAPHSPHGASPAMIRAGFEVANSTGTPFHIHVAEGQYEGARTLEEHGATPIRYLDKLGVLGERMIGVHCVWLDDDEVRLMAPGHLADLVAVDLAHPSLHPPSRLLKNVVYAMSPQAITDVWVHGRPVVARQRLATLDQETLMERVRRLTHDWTPA